MVYIINGCSITADAGVVYYKFVPDSEPEKKTVPETAPVVAQSPAYAYSYDPAPSEQSAFGTIGLVCFFLLTLLSPWPGDEIVAGGALFLAIP